MIEATEAYIKLLRRSGAPALRDALTPPLTYFAGDEALHVHNLARAASVVR